MSFIKNPDHPHLPICQFMRTKASYIPDMRNEFYMEMHHPYNQYHCLKTLHNIGPDDDICCPEDCTPDRPCFEAMFEQTPVADKSSSDQNSQQA
jgi:hypothetical protein